jgi:hypothetical protein
MQTVQPGGPGTPFLAFSTIKKRKFKVSQLETETKRKLSATTQQGGPETLHKEKINQVPGKSTKNRRSEADCLQPGGPGTPTHPAQPSGGEN